MPTMSATYQRDRRAKIAMSNAAGGLLPFQKRFVASLTRKQAAPEIGILCSPRAQGKSWLIGRLIGRSLTPGDDLHEDAVSNVLGGLIALASCYNPGIRETGGCRRARNTLVERWGNPR